MKVIFTTFDKKKHFSMIIKMKEILTWNQKTFIVSHFFAITKDNFFLCYCVIIVVIFPAFRPTFDFD